MIKDRTCSPAGNAKGEAVSLSLLSRSLKLRYRHRCAGVELCISGRRCRNEASSTSSPRFTTIPTPGFVKNPGSQARRGRGRERVRSAARTDLEPSAVRERGELRVNLSPARLTLQCSINRTQRSGAKSEPPDRASCSRWPSPRNRDFSGGSISRSRSASLVLPVE